MNGIISHISYRNLKFLFVYGSDKSLKRLEGKTGEGPFFKVQSGQISVSYDEKCFINSNIINRMILYQGQDMLLETTQT